MKNFNKYVFFDKFVLAAENYLIFLLQGLCFLKFDVFAFKGFCSKKCIIHES